MTVAALSFLLLIHIIAQFHAKNAIYIENIYKFSILII